MINNSPKVKRFIYITGFTSIILGSVCIIFLAAYVYLKKPPQLTGCEKQLEEQVRPLAYKAVILKVDNENCSMELITEKQDTLTICLCNDMIQARNLSPGDSLTKPAEKLILYRYNFLTKLNEYIDYPCCE